VVNTAYLGGSYYRDKDEAQDNTSSAGCQEIRPGDWMAKKECCCGEKHFRNELKTEKSVGQLCWLRVRLYDREQSVEHWGKRKILSLLNGKGTAGVNSLLSTRYTHISKPNKSIHRERMVLTESPYLSESSWTLRTSNVSSNAYILSISSLPRHYAASTSAPSNVIEIFDKSTLQRIQSLPGHESATTSLHAVNTIAGIPKKSLISSGKDGSVKVWDDRSNSHSIKSDYLQLHDASSSALNPST
jgi:WD40 repeat protein